MKTPIFDKTINDVLKRKIQGLEKHFNADIAFYYGQIDPAFIRQFRNFIEQLATNGPKRERIAFFIGTFGGSAEAVEKMVEIVRFHYSEVYFLVPDVAFSAGTILCMAGDRIYMDYSSSLGPIDPQVYNGTSWVPALGYLDKVEAFLEKAQQGTLTNAEFMILQNQDLALLSKFEQARDLTVTLIKRWLVEYKFKDWIKHRSHPERNGSVVTEKQKLERAEDIATKLGDNKLWHSHGRMIGPAKLERELRLKINDYSKDVKLSGLIRGYNDLLTEYLSRHGINFFLHSKHS